MKRHFGVLALILSAFAIADATLPGSPGFAQGDRDDDPQDAAALSRALAPVKVTLEAGLATAASQGRPISGKFEIENGVLQLSYYTEKGGRFFEVIVDHVKGTVAKSEPIAEPDDLGDAKEQGAAMEKATRTLHDAVAKVAAAHKGARATGVVPTIRNGHPVATVRLLTGSEWSSATEPLD